MCPLCPGYRIVVRRDLSRFEKKPLRCVFKGSQIWSVLLSPAQARRLPSGDQASALILPAWLLCVEKEPTGVTFQTCTLLPVSPEARYLPSGDQASAVTAVTWPR